MQRLRLYWTQPCGGTIAPTVTHPTCHLTNQELTMPFFDLSNRPSKELFAGVTTQSFWGEKMLLSWVTLAPDAIAPAHNHPHEQAGVVISGTLDFMIGDESRTLQPGDMYLVPGDVVHAAHAGSEGCVVLEIFSPVRELLQY
jgi:quercetin dioxygenase-like cupin family protein